MTVFDAVDTTTPSVGPAPISSDRTDVLSAFLAPCRVECRWTRLWRLTAPWGFEMVRNGPGFFIVLEGACFLQAPGVTGDLALRQNDFVVLTRADTTVLRDSPDSRVISVNDSPASPDHPLHEVRHLGGGGTSTPLLWGALTSEDDYTRQALHLLPPFLLVHGRGADAVAGLEPLLNFLLAELADRRPGGTLLVDRLLHALLVLALRATPPTLPNSEGLVRALSVPGLGVALAAIHAHPGREWSVNELAELAGLSRSKFSLRFVEMLGCPPFDYLRDVRMRLACQLLHESNHGIKEISARVGYSTEASFSRAFSHWCGSAPGTYRRQKRTPPAGEAVST